MVCVCVCVCTRARACVRTHPLTQIVSHMFDTPAHTELHLSIVYAHTVQHLSMNDFMWNRHEIMTTVKICSYNNFRLMLIRLTPLHKSNFLNISKHVSV
jgi:hypothetical protein